MKRVYWLNQFNENVPAILIKVAKKKCLIQFQEKIPYTKTYQTIQKWVYPTTLKDRIIPYAILNEPPQCVVNDHSISFSEKLPCHVFPNGVFYGTLDGLEITSPHGSKERAMEEALHYLQSGKYTKIIENRKD